MLSLECLFLQGRERRKKRQTSQTSGRIAPTY